MYPFGYQCGCFGCIALLAKTNRTIRLLKETFDQIVFFVGNSENSVKTTGLKKSDITN